MARLFHSLVVCGAGLTLLQCGGRYGQRGDEGEGEGAGTSAGGTASKPSGGTSSGGSSSTAGSTVTAGSLNLAGAAPTMPAGGTTSAGPGRPTGPTEQWGCDASSTLCRSQRFELEYLDCAFDPTRPVEAQDCKGDAVFTCLRGRLDDKAVLFNCACVPPSPEMACVCPPVLDNCMARVAPPPMCSPFISECDCAITCILK